MNSMNCGRGCETVIELRSQTFVLIESKLNGRNQTVALQPTLNAVAQFCPFTLSPWCSFADGGPQHRREVRSNKLPAVSCSLPCVTIVFLFRYARGTNI